MVLSGSDKKELLRIATHTLSKHFQKKESIVPLDKTIPDALLAECGVFVSIYVHNNLKGCIGRFESSLPLYKLVADMTIAAATKDYRFSPVKSDELRDVTIEISVLTPLKKINSPEEIEIGKHGIYIMKDGKKGTLLPKVATDMGWNREEFLGHCARDKAHIGWDAWKEAELYTYEAIIIRG
jgi:AmmeMemoRadiSam system protein A